MTHTLEHADKIYEEMKVEHPTLDHDLVMEWREKMPKQFTRKMLEKKHGKHIFDEDCYNEYVSYLVNRDDSHGPHWRISDIKEKSGIDFGSKEYTCYDYAYVVNMLFSDYGDIFADPSYYLKMAKNYLSDADYYGDPSERAYCDAIKRMEYYQD